MVGSVAVIVTMMTEIRPAADTVAVAGALQNQLEMMPSTTTLSNRESSVRDRAAHSLFVTSRSVVTKQGVKDADQSVV